MTFPVLKIDHFGPGLDAYWEQFAGRKERLAGSLHVVIQKLKAVHPEIVEQIFLYIPTHALSSLVLLVVQRAKIPVVLLNLSPEVSIDCASFNNIKDRTGMAGKWLASCSASLVPRIANVFNRVGIPFQQITGMLSEDEACRDEVREWIEAAKVVGTTSNDRLGCIGHSYNGMRNIYAEPTQRHAHFGGHIELLEVDELSALRKDVSAPHIKKLGRLLHMEAVQDC